MFGIEEQAAKHFFGQVWEDVVGYLKVYDYLKLKAKSTSGRKKPVRSVADFWYSALGDKFATPSGAKFQHLRDGDIIKFKDIFLTEWMPKLPGRVWTEEGVAEFEEGNQRVEGYYQFADRIYAVLDPRGKKKVVNAGFGTIRLARKSRKSDTFMCLAAVGEQEWHCDYGVPIVVSKPVYERFVERGVHGAPWAKELEGVLRIHEDLPFSEVIPRAIGSALSPESESTLRYRPRLNKCYIHVISPLSMKLKYNDSHPDITAWAMYDRKKKRVRHLYDRDPYGYTYVKCNPLSSESMENAVEFINWYVKKYGGRSIVTDFDGMVPRLQAEIPIKKNPLNEAPSKVKNWLIGIDNWVAQTLRLSGR